MRKRNKIALIVLAVFYISFGVFLAVYQENIVYYPNTQDFINCEDFKTAKKIDYNGTRMYVKDTDKPIVVLYHGNAGSACNRKFYADIFSQAGYGYMIIEYAGYSNDAKNPSHELIKHDVQNVLEYINENHFSRITVVGESIGTGVASYHVSLQSPDKLLLISPFSDLADIAKNRFWFYPTSILVNNAFDNIANLSQYQNPITIIHGNNDTIIPHKLGQKLFISLKTKKNFVTIEGAGHNDLFVYPETYTTVTNFLKSH
jgi:pimeloyl-ACP methyl ester carboxylesterase